jgi:hypothetical protein
LPWLAAKDATVNHVRFLRRSLLLAWAVWLSVVLLSNLADAGKEAGLLGESWTFASGNWKAIKETTARYGTPNVANALMFAGVIVWEGIATSLFWWAFLAFRGNKAGRKILYLAFTTALLLWAALFISDEVFVVYPLEGTHLRLFIAFLVTLLAIELLPDE